MKRLYKIALAIGVIGALFALYYTFLSDYFTLEVLKKNNMLLKNFVSDHYAASVFLYIATFGLAVACGLPLVIPFACIGGFLYDWWPGIVYVQAACVFGSILSFVVLRYVIASWLHGWHNARFHEFNLKLARYGNLYLLALHFLSVIPMVVINVLASLARIPLFTVAWVTLVGSLPLNIIAVFAGRQLGSINSFKEIFSPMMIGSLIVLAAVCLSPLLIKKLQGVWRV